DRHIIRAHHDGKRKSQIASASRPESAMKTRNIIIIFLALVSSVTTLFAASIFASEEARDQETSIWHRSRRSCSPLHNHELARYGSSCHELRRNHYFSEGSRL